MSSSYRYVQKNNVERERGSMIVLSIIFGAIFLMMLTSLTGYILTQKKTAQHVVEKERAIEIAEAGIEYYKWHLAHFPDDLQDGTGAPGPYVHTYDDPETGNIGSFSLEIGGTSQCGKIAVIEATSTGWTNDDPSTKRSVYVRIARPTVADYSYIVDDNVFAGSDRTIIGPYHSNGGIRMDGDNQSVVTSKLSAWNCTSSYGCSPASSTASGVLGTGDHPELWRWPVADISFSNFNYDFDAMKQTATMYGLSFAKISDDDPDGTGVYGYHIVLKNNRTVDVYRVTAVRWVTSTTPPSLAISFPELLGNETYSYASLATKQTLIGNYAIPASCGLIYVEDRVWLDGVVKGKVTVVANDTGLNDPDMFLLSNITYANSSVEDGLTALAERHLLIPLYVPNDMTISGIFFAQSGAYGRNNYGNVDFGNNKDYTNYKQQNSLTTNGTVVSKLRTGTKWTGGSWQGFNTRYDYYDRNLAKDPPPLTPFTSANFSYQQWREVQ